MNPIRRTKYHIGDACLCWSFGDTIDLEISTMVLSVFQKLHQPELRKSLMIRDLVPSYNALAVHYDPVNVAIDQLTAAVENIIDQYSVSQKSSKPEPAARSQHNLPVVYKGDDLERVSLHTKMTIEEVIALHQKPDYVVAMIGFQPNFPYLIGLPPQLETPRLESPRTLVPAGAVAIGGSQTGIYPQQSPGGWNIIGLTDPEALKVIEPGDIIKFQGVETL